jgi:hypothetical protein
VGVITKEHFNGGGGPLNTTNNEAKLSCYILSTTEGGTDGGWREGGGC